MEPVRPTPEIEPDGAEAAASAQRRPRDRWSALAPVAVPGPGETFADLDQENEALNRLRRKSGRDGVGLPLLLGVAAVSLAVIGAGGYYFFKPKVPVIPVAAVPDRPTAVVPPPAAVVPPAAVTLAPPAPQPVPAAPPAEIAVVPPPAPVPATPPAVSLPPASPPPVVSDDPATRVSEEWLRTHESLGLPPPRLVRTVPIKPPPAIE